MYLELYERAKRERNEMKIVKKHLTDITKNYPVPTFQNITDKQVGQMIVDSLNKENENHDFYYELED